MEERKYHPVLVKLSMADYDRLRDAAKDLYLAPTAFVRSAAMRAVDDREAARQQREEIEPR